MPSKCSFIPRSKSTLLQASQCPASIVSIQWSEQYHLRTEGCCFFYLWTSGLWKDVDNCIFCICSCPLLLALLAEFFHCLSHRFKEFFRFLFFFFFLTRTCICFYVMIFWMILSLWPDNVAACERECLYACVYKWRERERERENVCPCVYKCRER